jgi:RNA polymerase sigma-70 factor, ECF subfamily
LGESTTSPNAESDEALLAAVQRRDERALAVLYDRYGGLAFGLAYRIVDDRGAAEDVVQDAFMSVWRRAVSFQLDRGSARTWLLSIVHHRAIDRLRGAAGKTRRDTPLDEVDRVLSVEDPWREVIVRVQGEVVKRGLATLPEAQRQTIELAYFGGYTQQEIAAAMDVPVGTVKGRMRIGLQKLRELLSGAGVELR